MRKRTISILSVGLILLLVTPTAFASSPAIQGGVFGIELCPQFICGAAIFSGTFVGRLGTNFNTVGNITAAMTHEELPTGGGCSLIKGGLWEIKTFLRKVQGGVQYGGLICDNQDGTFAIHATLVPTSSGYSGSVAFEGTLNHNTLIPTFSGVLQ